MFNLKSSVLLNFKLFKHMLTGNCLIRCSTGNGEFTGSRCKEETLVNDLISETAVNPEELD